MKNVDPGSFEVLKSFENKKSRFDYFLIGTSLAIVAFTAEQFDGSRQYKCFYLVAISWVLFLFTAAMGIGFVNKQVKMARFIYDLLLDKEVDEIERSKYQQWNREEPCRRRVVLFSFFLGIVFLCIFRVLNGFQ